jgi:thioredoxin 1
MPALTPLDEFGFHHTLAGVRGIALVIFTSIGCNSCRAWKRLLAGYRLKHPEVALFEVDAGHAQALAREFSVFHLPALFLYRDGHFHCALQAEAHPDKLPAAIEAALASPAQETP